MPLDPTIHAILSSVRTIAVLGAHTDAARPASYVPTYMAEQGYRILPVNAMQKGATLCGEPMRAGLDELDEPVDLVCVFRRAEAIPAHVPEILGMRAVPRVVWFQLGIVHDDAAAALRAGGVEVVVQDRCLMADHRVGRVGRVA